MLEVVMDPVPGTHRAEAIFVNPFLYNSVIGSDHKFESTLILPMQNWSIMKGAAMARIVNQSNFCASTRDINIHPQ